MNKVHAFVLKQLRDRLPEQIGEAGASGYLDMNDEQLLRALFMNYRDGRGMRLSHQGLSILLDLFQAFDIKRPMKSPLPSAELLYLDRRATLPYYISGDRVVVFESQLGMMIKLADGNFDTLLAAEG